MLNSSILDIAMGMVFLFVLISLLCSAINEMIAQFLRMRAKNLEAGLINLLQSGGGNQLVDDLYKHPLINGLSKTGQKPSYIPPKNFTLALMDIMTGNTGKLPADNKALIETIERQGLFAKTEAGRSIILLLHEAGDDAEKARKNLEGWYNDAMDRVGGWYKQKTQIIIFGIALIVCAALNIDAIKISQTLWTDIALRQALIEAASSAKIENLVSQVSMDQNQAPAVGDANAKQPDSKAPNAEIEGTKQAPTDNGQSVKSAGMLLEQIKALNLPIGWAIQKSAKEQEECKKFRETEIVKGKDDKNVKEEDEKKGKVCDTKWVWVSENFDGSDWLKKIIGILITTFAASLGAPFWFQLLNKIVDLRAAGKQPAKSVSDK